MRKINSNNIQFFPQEQVLLLEVFHLILQFENNVDVFLEHRLGLAQHQLVFLLIPFLAFVMVLALVSAHPLSLLPLTVLILPFQFDALGSPVGFPSLLRVHALIH